MSFMQMINSSLQQRIQLLSEPQYVIKLTYLTGGSFLLTVLSLIGLILWIRRPFPATRPSNVKEISTYDNISLIGLIMFCTFSGISVCLSCTTVESFLRYTLTYCRKKIIYIALIVYTSLSALYFVIALIGTLTWAKLPLSCGVLFCIGDKYLPDYSDDKIFLHGFNGTIAMMVLFSLYPLSMVMLCRIFLLWLSLSKVTRNEVSVISETNEIANSVVVVVNNDVATFEHKGVLANARCYIYTTNSRRKQVFLLFVVVLLIICFFIPTTYLPSNGYVMAPFIIQRTARIIPSRDTLTAILTVPELPHALFRTRGVKISSNLWLKMYPGNVMFYGYLITLLVLIVTLRLTQKGRYWLSRRMPYLPSWSVCEAVCLALTVVLVIFFGIYWIHDHNYKAYWNKDAAPEDLMCRTEAWARGFGQIAVLLLSLLLFPISRHSVLFQLLGTSWDSMIWLHRILGYAMMIITLAHIIFYYIVFYKQGVLMHNLNKLPTIIVGKRTFGSDWSIQLITWTTWLMFMSMGLFALNRIRRRCYELFYYSHLIASYALLPAVLWHAASSWQCMLPGLTLWLVDQLIRLFHNSSLVHITRARVVTEDVVELGYELQSIKFTNYYPGHYAFINIPEISPLQWHPFTISSCISTSNRTLLESLLTSPQSLLTSTTQYIDAVTSNNNNSNNIINCKESNKNNAMERKSNASNEFKNVHNTFMCNENESESVSEHSPLQSNGQVYLNNHQDSNVMTMHIKRLNRKSWTGQLYERVLYNKPLSMSVKGPCGTPIDYHHYRDIFLVCGGIGVAPCASIFGSLLREHAERYHYNHSMPLQRVYLIWMTRSAALIGALSEILGFPEQFRSLAHDTNDGSISNNNNDGNNNSHIESSHEQCSVDRVAAQQQQQQQQQQEQQQEYTISNDVFEHDGDNVVETNDTENEEQHVTIEAPSDTEEPQLTKENKEITCIEQREVGKYGKGEIAQGKDCTTKSETNPRKIISPLYNHFNCQIFVTRQDNYSLLCERRICTATSVCENVKSTTASKPHEASTNVDTHHINNDINNSDNNCLRTSCANSLHAENHLADYFNTANANGLFPIEINFGRANIVNEITGHINKVTANPLMAYDREKALVFACGPSLLVHESVKAAAKHKISFHEEVFEL